MSLSPGLCPGLESHEPFRLFEQKGQHNCNERLKGEFKHPTQKPLRVLSHIVKLASNEGGIILDPFMGVGSTGVAALNLNRKFIGIEVDPKYYEGASIRLDKISQRLF